MSKADSPHAADDVRLVFAALGDATRLELVARLGNGRRRSIAQLADGLELTHQGVTKHLHVLEEAGLVKSERMGREKHYICVPQPITAARTYLDTVAAQWDAALSRLSNFIEEQD